MNQPFDQAVKLFAEDDPRGFLYLFAGVPLDAPVSIEPVERELQVQPIHADHAYLVTEEQRQWICHFEAQTRYRSDVPDRLARYGTMLWLVHNKPVETTLVLLAEEYAPRVVPEEHTVDAGGLLLRVRFRVVKLWEMDAARALESGRPSLLPWVMAMRASDEQIGEAARRLKRTRDNSLMTESLTLARLRYDKSNPDWLLERLSEMLLSEQAIEDLIEISGFCQYVKDLGEKEGCLKEIRRVIRRVAARRFPNLGDLPELESISQIDVLESLLDRLAIAVDLAAAQTAVREIGA
ncbi:MAG: hypothetical protein ACRD8O_19635 [Bryobacteraceae bacterium]